LNTTIMNNNMANIADFAGGRTKVRVSQQPGIYFLLVRHLFPSNLSI